MTETVEARIEPLADLLDSRPDLREILARNPNLAHACLLLRRGEAEDVEKALELALRQPDADATVIAECIRVELLRLSGDRENALARMEALARSERFHPAPVLCLRNFFPLMDAGHPHVLPVLEVEVAPPDPDTLAGSEDSDSASDSQAVDAPAIEPSTSGLPAVWNPISNDPSVVFLRLRTPDGLEEFRREDLAAGALEDIVLARTGQILSKMGLGELRHAAFDGAQRTVHAWNNGPRSALAVMATGASTSLLAARCTKAFQDGIA